MVIGRGISVMYTTEKEEHIIRKNDYEENKEQVLYKLQFIDNIMESRDQQR